MVVIKKTSKQTKTSAVCKQMR